MNVLTPEKRAELERRRAEEPESPTMIGLGLLTAVLCARFERVVAWAVLLCFAFPRTLRYVRRELAIGALVSDDYRHAAIEASYPTEDLREMAD